MKTAKVCGVKSWSITLYGNVQLCVGGETDEVSRQTAARPRLNLLLICLGCNMRRSELQEFSVKLLVINLTDTEVSEAMCLHYSLSHCHHT